MQANIPTDTGVSARERPDRCRIERAADLSFVYWFPVHVRCAVILLWTSIEYIADSVDAPTSHTRPPAAHATSNTSLVYSFLFFFFLFHLLYFVSFTSISTHSTHPFLNLLCHSFISSPFSRSLPFSPVFGLLLTALLPLVMCLKKILHKLKTCSTFLLSWSFLVNFIAGEMRRMANGNKN